MKSALIHERAFGRRESVAGDASDLTSNFKGGLTRINQELWLVLSLFIIAGRFNWLVVSHRMILGLYTLPTIFSAYVYGRRHAVLTATASICIVLVLVFTNTHLLVVAVPVLDYEQWAELITWASLLLITAYAMGTLYDRKERVAIALLKNSDEMPSTFRAGASFVLVRPLSPTVLMRTLKASYPLMVRERRRSFRCPLQIPIYVSAGSRPEFMAMSANISEGGIALTTPAGLQVGERVVLRFALPGLEDTAQISAEVCWNTNAGRAGMEFAQVPGPVKEQLVAWLADRLGESLLEEAVLKL
jgi:Tfp pilus assembly protein PilZ